MNAIVPQPPKDLEACKGCACDRSHPRAAIGAPLRPESLLLL